MVLSTNSPEGYSEYRRSDATVDSEEDSVTVTVWQIMDISATRTR
ncbi:unnamed protein product [Acanthoscelides obtectus]|uniref:Uncharacterized protein n=1 Tax=Acanthoscelides obtectus TaxID=200917 RepID=A0A9P0K0Z1_ACAOB|nr:unnamed protein product [Acanthoscelides obtectus]CAK1629104.1 hypothetical protein AOBTE_LOCUS5581 [Acanthoscelides obtectus]